MLKHSGRSKIVFEELFLFSGQFGLFYILMQFILEGFDFFKNVSHIMLLVVLIIQTLLLAKFGHKKLPRVFITFLVPFIYSIFELSEGLVDFLNTAHIGFWLYAVISAFLMIMRSSGKEILKRFSETIMVFVNITIFMFLYFYLDTVKQVSQKSGLTILEIGKYLNDFLGDKPHWYIIIGGLFLALILAYSRYELSKIKDKIYNLFGKYVDKEIRDKIIHKGEFQAKNENLCIVFSDIKKFTNMCENIEPYKISEMLNIYFNYWNLIVKKYNGTVDKFIGDAIMIIFGLEDNNNGCNNAVKCSLDAINNKDKLISTLKRNGLPVPEGFGIGLHYGELIIGDIGSSDRKNFTVIGDTVNIASRLESVTRVNNCSIVLSSEVYNNIDRELQKKFTHSDTVKVKGREREIKIWQKK